MKLNIEQKLDAQWIIALWLFIHGGDPGPGENIVSEDTAKGVAAQVVHCLMPYLEEGLSDKVEEELLLLAAKSIVRTTDVAKLIDALNNFGFKLFIHDGHEHLELTPQNAAMEPPTPRTCICVGSPWGDQRCNCVPQFI